MAPGDSAPAADAAPVAVAHPPAMPAGDDASPRAAATPCPSMETATATAATTAGSSGPPSCTLRRCLGLPAKASGGPSSPGPRVGASKSEITLSKGEGGAKRMSSNRKSCPRVLESSSIAGPSSSLCERTASANGWSMLAPRRPRSGPRRDADPVRGSGVQGRRLAAGRRACGCSAGAATRVAAGIEAAA